MRWLSVHAIAEPVALCFVTVTKLLVLGRLIYFINRDGRTLGSRWVMLWRYLVGFVVLGNAAGFCGSIAASVFFTRAADAMSSSSSRYRDQEVVRREGFSDITSGTRTASVFIAFETIMLLVIVLAFSIVGVRSARIIREALTAVSNASSNTTVSMSVTNPDAREKFFEATIQLAIVTGRTLKRKVVGTCSVAFLSFLVRAFFSLLFSLSNALQVSNVDCPNFTNRCSDCYNTFSHILTWYLYSPDIIFPHVLVFEPVALLVVLWGMTSGQVLQT
jgi:hypothetical protein